MTEKALQEDRLYLQTHGFRCRPVELNAALVKVIDTMPQTLYGESARELSAAEAEVARSGGLVLEEQDGPDPLAQMAAEYAAIGARMGTRILQIVSGYAGALLSVLHARQQAGSGAK